MPLRLCAWCEEKPVKEPQHRFCSHACANQAQGIIKGSAVYRRMARASHAVQRAKREAKIAEEVKRMRKVDVAEVFWERGYQACWQALYRQRRKDEDAA